MRTIQLRTRGRGCRICPSTELAIITESPTSTGSCIALVAIEGLTIRTKMRGGRSFMIQRPAPGRTGRGFHTSLGAMKLVMIIFQPTSNQSVSVSWATLNWNDGGARFSAFVWDPTRRSWDDFELSRATGLPQIRGP